MSEKSRRSGKLRSWLFIKAEAVIPTEFYEVREETEPKADWCTMFGFTAFLYLAVVAGFVAIFLQEASRTTTQSIISDYDYKGEDGYTCKMLSKVSASFQYANRTGIFSTLLAYNLVNVIQTEEQSRTNLALAKPCSSQLSYFGGEGVPLFEKGEELSALSMFSDRAVYWINANRKEIYAYTYPDGFYYVVGSLVGMDLVTNTMAVTKLGQPLCLVRNANNTRTIYIYNGVYEPLYDTELHYDPVLVNDNFYNLYMIQRDRFVFVNLSSTPITETTLFQLPNGEIIKSASVYHDGVDPQVYFTVQQGGMNGNITFYRCKDGLITHTPVVTKYFAYVLDVMVDGHNNVYYLCTYDFSDECKCLILTFLPFSRLTKYYSFYTLCILYSPFLRKR